MISRFSPFVLLLLSQLELRLGSNKVESYFEPSTGAARDIYLVCGGRALLSLVRLSAASFSSPQASGNFLIWTFE